MSDWEIMAYAVVLPIAYEDPVPIPSGWEPIGALARQGNNAVVLCRRQVGGGPPVIDRLQPASLAAGGTPATVDIIGSGFDPSCHLLADDVEQTTFYIDDTRLQVTARPDQANPGESHVITVRNDAGVTSNAVTFAYT